VWHTTKNRDVKQQPYGNEIQTITFHISHRHLQEQNDRAGVLANKVEGAKEVANNIRVIE
jgi:hypothetical protein